MKYYIKTFGCQMNEHDSEILAGMMEDLGYEPGVTPDESDAVVINTCCIRESAENKIWGYIANLKHLKEMKPEMVIAVGGCMAQQPEVAERIRKRAPQVDVIFGTLNMHRLPDLIQKAANEHRLAVEVYSDEGEIPENLPVKRGDRIKAQVTIMFGCNNFCSYCIVPYVRGRERSRQPGDIEREIQVLTEQGYKEVMLLGQNVNSYGQDLTPPMDFADLLRGLDQIPGLERIRYMTSHPRDFTGKLIQTIAGADKICEHFHLPIQAGSNKILGLMNRGYTRETYLKLVEEIKKNVPDCSVTTDIIVGFPGETEQDFADTLDIVRQAEFDNAYTFIYSPRSGTPAAEMPGQVPLHEKKARLQVLMDLLNSYSLAANQKLRGKKLEVLVEGPSKNKTSMLSGRTRTNKIVIFPGNPHLTGSLVQVKIAQVKTWHLEGKLI